MKSLGSYSIHTGDTICLSHSDTAETIEWWDEEPPDIEYQSKIAIESIRFKARYAWDGNMNVSGMIPGTAVGHE